MTGDVRPNPGLSTWIVSDDGGQPWSPASTGGDGIIIGANPAARAVTDLGVDVPLDAIGVSESSDGYAESIACFD